jgi:glycosyltransferase involved in cell wall biosynthesis
MSAPDAEYINKISIVVPVYNEEESVKQVMGGLRDMHGDSEIIIVNDGSTDATGRLIAGYDFRIITHATNRGYGAALKSGIKNASNEVIVITDADGSYPTKDIRRLVEGLNSCEMAVGRRINSAKARLWKKAGKGILWLLADLAVGLKIPDVNSGLRAFKKDTIMRYLDLLPDSFSFSTTSTVIFLLCNRRIKYVPIELLERKGKSKVDMYSGIASILKVLLITMIFKPVRAATLILLPIAASILLVCILNYLVFGKPDILLLLSTDAVLLLGLIFIERISSCDRGLIVSEG